MTLKRFTLFSILMLSFANSLLASNDTLKISLEQAEQLFVNHSLAVIAARYDIDVAKANVVTARTWNNPNISYQQTLYDTLKRRPNKNEIDVQFHQMFSIAGKHTQAVKLAKIAADKSELSFNEALRELKYSLYTNYIQLYAAQEKIKLYSKIIDNLDRLITAAKQEFNLGAISGNELLRLRAEFRNIQNERIGVFGDLLEAQKNLKILLNVPATSYLEVNNPANNINNLPTIETALTTAEKYRPDLLLANKEVEYQQRNLTLQRATRIPDVTLGIEYDKAGSYINNYYGIGASMDLPLFNRNQGQVRAAKATVKKVEVLDTLQQNLVRSEVVSAYLRLNSIKNQTELLSSSYPNEIEQLLDGALKNYNKRYISLLEFLDQIRTYNAAKQSLIELNADYFSAKQYLNYTTGMDLVK